MTVFYGVLYGPAASIILHTMKYKSAWGPMAPLSTPPCVALRVYNGMDQWLPDATAGLIINYYTSVHQNEHIRSIQHPQSWPVAAERWLSAPPTPQPPHPPSPLHLYAQRHQPEPLPRQWDMPRDNICLPLVTCRVKPTVESRARLQRSPILS